MEPETVKKEGKVISFINMKGGVGKTTASISTAKYLSEYKNKKVLFIDIDPQYNSTMSFLERYYGPHLYTLNDLNFSTFLDTFKGFKEQYDEDELDANFLYNEYLVKEEHTILRVFKQPKFNEKVNTENEDVIFKLTENLSIIPGDLNLIFFQDAQRKKLNTFIRENEIRSEFDYIIIDCPPTLTRYTDAAIFASDFYIIPNIIDRYSMQGIKSLREVIDQIKIDEETDRPECLGIVYTLVKKNMSKGLQNLKNYFESHRFIQDMKIFKSRFYVYDSYKSNRKGNFADEMPYAREDIKAFVEELEREISNGNNKSVSE